MRIKLDNEQKILQILIQMQGDISIMKNDISELKSDVCGLKSDVSTLKSDVSTLKSDVSALKSDVSALKSKTSSMQHQLDENTQMIRSLIEASEINKAEHDNINHQIAQLSGEMKQGFKENRELQKSLLEMYGAHEAELRTLRRISV